jgi:NAD(P)-dependent dehydrogenase (short-subunit alcohol dehydrogenase family)
MKTVFITGASSGIGKATAKLFQKKGWNVIATMRNPQAEKELTGFDNVKVVHCDVTDLESVKTAIREGVAAFKSIDVLINNAGYGAIGPLEAATHEQIKREIDTNLLGLIAVTKEMLPYFRKQKSGAIINMSSVAGIITSPLVALYNATKWGVEGFSESLHYELQPFNIRVKIVEPGIIKTDFFDRSMTVLQDDTLTEYEAYSKKVIRNFVGNAEKNGSSPDGVAETIFKAATDNNKKLRYPTGKMKEVILLRKILPFRIYAFLTKWLMEK